MPGASIVYEASFGAKGCIFPPAETVGIKSAPTRPVNAAKHLAGFFVVDQVGECPDLQDEKAGKTRP